MASSDIAQCQLLNGLREDSHPLKLCTDGHRAIPGDKHLLDPGIRVGRLRVHDRHLADLEARDVVQART
jgi:hypothetical protein